MIYKRTKYAGVFTREPTRRHVATAIIGSAAIGAATTAFTSSKAAKAQTDAARMGQDTIREQYAQTREDLSPFRQGGVDALGRLQERLPFLTSGIDVSAELRDPNSTASKAYDFTKTQGEKAVGNSAIARGLGLSGALGKGLARYTTGLADNTYRGLFDMENTNRTNEYNRLMGLVNTGQNAAAQTASAGSTAAQGQAALGVGAGNAQAASWNAIGTGVNQGVNNFTGYNIYKGLYGDRNSGGNGGNLGWDSGPGNGYQNPYPTYG